MTNENLYTAAVLTVSDGVNAGVREDKSGDALEELLTSAGFNVIHREVVPDERQLISSALTRYAASRNIHCVVTTGGTGVGPRDVTPEATADVLERTIPGMAEAMRADGIQHTPYAMLSRQLAGVSKETLIINLPGSERAVRECFAVLKPVIKHVIHLITGDTEHRPGNGPA